MRSGAELGPMEAENFPPVYLTHQPHANAGMRFFEIPTLIIPRQVLFVKHSILLTQIIRGPLTLRLAIHLRLSFRLSRLPLGTNFICVFSHLYTHTDFLNPLAVE